MLDALPLDRVALTLLHFVWQGFLIALAAAAVMALVRSASTRYAVGCAGLLAMVIMPLVTFAQLGRDPLDVRTVAPSARLSVPTAVPAVAASSGTARVELASTPAWPAPWPAAWYDSLAPVAPAAVTLWLVGVGVLGIRHALGFAAVVRLRRDASSTAEPSLLARLDRVAAQLGISRHVALLTTHDLTAPAVVGWLRPAILWPATLITGLTPSQLDGLLAHELAHVRRHDYLVNLLQAVIETLGFYHPSVWWLSRRVRQEREHCCDDIAATLVGDRAHYAATLASIESLRCPPALAIGSSGGSLLRRVQRLLSLPTSSRSSTSVLRVILPLIVLATAATAIAVKATSSADQPARLPVGKVLANSADAERPIAVGDELHITLRGATGADSVTMTRAKVIANGEAEIPGIGRVGAVGLTPAQLESDILERLGRGFNPWKMGAGVLNITPRPIGAPASLPTTTTSTAGDYRIAGGDLLRISIGALEASGTTSVLIKRVANSGGINLPYFKMPFMLAGQTEAEARATIMAAYVKAKILTEPIVDVIVVEGSDGKKVPVELLAIAGTTAMQQQQQIAELTRQLAELSAKLGAATTREAAAPVRIDERLLAQNEPFFEMILRQRDQLAVNLDKLQVQEGPRAPRVIDLQQQLDRANKQIALIAEQLTKEQQQPK